jgi:hypothetical protein
VVSIIKSKIDISILLPSVIILLIVINGYVFKTPREYIKPFWIEGRVASYSCSDGKFSIHSIKLDNYERNILLANKSLSCEDIITFKNTSNINVKISLGYENTPYSYGLISDGKVYKSNFERVSENRYQSISSFEFLIIFILFGFIITRLSKRVHKNKH